VAKAAKKAQRKEEAIKKAKRKKQMIIGICALVVVAVAVVAVITIIGQRGTETYSTGGQTVQLQQDGTFSATLAHGVRRNGTFTKTVENNRTTVTFNTGGVIEIGWIENNALHIPNEWDDGHGHGSVLTRS